MSKVTATKLIRMQFAHGDKPLLDALPVEIQKCKVCKQPMFVADGQLAFVHSECRSKHRHKDARTIQHKK